MRWFAKIKRFVMGEEIDEILFDLKNKTDGVCKKVDELLERAQMDGESHWFENNSKDNKNHNDRPMKA